MTKFFTCPNRKHYHSSPHNKILDLFKFQSICRQQFNFIPHIKILTSFKLIVFVDDKLIVNQKHETSLLYSTKHCRKRRKCCLPAFYPFSIQFLKGSLKVGTVWLSVTHCSNRVNFLLKFNDFLLLPQFFQKVHVSGSLHVGIVLD